MNEETVSIRLPKTAEERALTKKAIRHLLMTISDRWKDYDSNDLTESEQDALFLLNAAGMIERSCRFRLRLRNRRSSVEAEISVTGERGGIEALEPLFGELWIDWADDWRSWQTGDTNDVPPLHCETIPPGRWRLTKAGVQARKELTAGNFGHIYSFVLKTDPFKYRDPVRGRGRLLRIVHPEPREQPEIEPTAVSVQNWDEGADKITTALCAHFDARFEQLEQAAKGHRRKAAKKKSEQDPETRRFEDQFWSIYTQRGLKAACHELGLDERKATKLRGKLKQRCRRAAEKAEKERRGTKPRQG